MSSTKTTKKRPRAAHLGPVKRRPMVLDAALGVFAKKGYERTSMDDVADAAGVTKPVVYECYENKRALFEALLKREEERLTAGLEVIVPEASNLAGAAFEEQLAINTFTQIFKGVVANTESWRVCYMTEHGTDPEVSKLVNRGRKRQLDRMQAVTKLRLAEWGVSDLDRKAELLSRTMVGMSETFIYLLLQQPKNWSTEELGEYVGRFIAKGELVLKD